MLLFCSFARFLVTFSVFCSCVRPFRLLLLPPSASALFWFFFTSFVTRSNLRSSFWAESALSVVASLSVACLGRIYLFVLGLRPVLASTLHPPTPGFQALLELLVTVPVFLPSRRDLLRPPPFRCFHQYLLVLRLTTSRISSDPPTPSVSLGQWLDYLPAAIVPPPAGTIKPISQSIGLGVLAMGTRCRVPLFRRWFLSCCPCATLSLSLSLTLRSLRSTLC